MWPLELSGIIILTFPSAQPWATPHCSATRDTSLLTAVVLRMSDRWGFLQSQDLTDSMITFRNAVKNDVSGGPLLMVPKCPQHGSHPGDMPRPADYKTHTVISLNKHIAGERWVCPQDWGILWVAHDDSSYSQIELRLQKICSSGKKDMGRYRHLRADLPPSSLAIVVVQSSLD